MNEAVSGWAVGSLTVRARYSRGADFSGTCVYSDRKILVNLGRHLRYPYYMGTNLARASNRSASFEARRPLYSQSLSINRLTCGLLRAVSRSLPIITKPFPIPCTAEVIQSQLRPEANGENTTGAGSIGSNVQSCGSSPKLLPTWRVLVRCPSNPAQVGTAVTTASENDMSRLSCRL